MAPKGGVNTEQKLTGVNPDANITSTRGILLGKSLGNLCFWHLHIYCPYQRLLFIFRYEGKVETGTLDPKPVLCVRQSLRVALPFSNAHSIPCVMVQMLA